MPFFARWRTLIVVMIGYAVVQMTLVPVTLIMPTLSKALGVPLRSASWLLTAYLLAMTVAILPAGRLGDRYGFKRVFLTGLTLLAASLVAAALSRSFLPLLILRVVQGVGCALINGTALAWVSNTYPEAYRGRVVGAVTLSSFIGGFSGTFLGTWAISAATWQWTFAAMVPLAALSLLLGLGTVEARPPAPGRRLPLDWAGALVLGLALTALSLSLSHLHEGAESWADGWAWHLPMHAVAAALLILFVVIEQRAADPMVPLPYLRNRAFLAALGANIALHLPMMGHNVILPFLMELGMGLTPAHLAVVIMVLQVISLLLAPFSGWLYDRVGARLLLPGSMAFITAALFLFGLTTTALSFPSLLGLAVLLGLGMGLFLAANNAALISAVPAEIRGFASGMLETTRQLGHGVAATVVGTILSYGVALAAEGGPRAALQAGTRSSYWFLAVLAGFGVICSVWYVRERGKEAATAAA